MKFDFENWNTGGIFPVHSREENMWKCVKMLHKKTFDDSSDSSQMGTNEVLIMWYNEFASYASSHARWWTQVALGFIILRRKNLYFDSNCNF